MYMSERMKAYSLVLKMVQAMSKKKKKNVYETGIGSGIGIIQQTIFLPKYTWINILTSKGQ